MGVLTTWVKDPDAVLDYVWDWSDWLDGDTIASHQVIVPAATGGLVVDSSSHTNTAVTVWLSGGTHRTDYRVTVRITTLAARTDDRSVTFEVRSR